MFNEFPTKEKLTGLGDALGQATPTIDLVVSPDERGAIYALRNGYNATLIAGPSSSVEDHKLFDVDSLVRFTQRYPAPTAQILVGDAEITFDVNPCDVEAAGAFMELEPHPRFAPWLAVLGKAIKPSQLRQLLLDSVDDTDNIESEGRVIGHTGTRIAAQLSKLKVARTAGATIEISDLGFIEAHGSNGTVSINEKIPTEFVIHVPLFTGVQDPSSTYEPTYPLTVKIGLQIVETEPWFTLRIPLLPVVRLKARRDVAILIQKLVRTENAPYVGLGNYGTRQYTGKVAPTVGVQIRVEQPTWVSALMRTAKTADVPTVQPPDSTPSATE